MAERGDKNDASDVESGGSDSLDVQAPSNEPLSKSSTESSKKVDSRSSSPAAGCTRSPSALSILEKWNQRYGGSSSPLAAENPTPGEYLCLNGGRIHPAFGSNPLEADLLQLQRLLEEFQISSPRIAAQRKQQKANLDTSVRSRSTMSGEVSKESVGRSSTMAKSSRRPATAPISPSSLSRRGRIDSKGSEVKVYSLDAPEGDNKLLGSCLALEPPEKMYT